MQKIASDVKKPRLERKFAAETARALIASAAVINQSRMKGQSRRSRKERSEKKSQGFAVSSISAPIARAVTVRPRVGLPDTRLRLRYTGGYLWAGGQVTGNDYGLSGDVYFTTSPGSPPTFLATATGLPSNWNPILPADVQSISSGLGFGAGYLYDILQHFARVRFNRILVHYEPFASGSSTTSQCTIAMAPLRGPATSYNATATNNPYALTATPTTLGSSAVGSVSANRDGVTFPSWQSMTLDLTPYIAGGSGPRQNEFPVFTINSTGAGSIIPAIAVPCCWTACGAYAGTALDHSFIGQFWIETDMEFMDFIGYLPKFTAPLGRDKQDVKAPVDTDVKRPPPLTFAGIVRRRVEDAPSPTQSLLGAELHTTHVVPAAARAPSAAMPIPERKPRGT